MASRRSRGATCWRGRRFTHHLRSSGRGTKDSMKGHFAKFQAGFGEVVVMWLIFRHKGRSLQEVRAHSAQPMRHSRTPPGPNFRQRPRLTDGHRSGIKFRAKCPAARRSKGTGGRPAKRLHRRVFRPKSSTPPKPSRRSRPRRRPSEDTGTQDTQMPTRFPAMTAGSR